MALVLSDIFGHVIPGGGTFQKIMTVGNSDASADENIDYNKYYGVDVSGGSITLTLPATAPSTADRIIIYDNNGTISNTNTVTVDFSPSSTTLFTNGDNESSIVIDQPYAHVELAYVNASAGWKLSYSNIVHT